MPLNVASINLSKMAGVAGFEPAHAGIKTRCLTAWRHPNFCRMWISSPTSRVAQRVVKLNAPDEHYSWSGCTSTLERARIVRIRSLPVKPVIARYA